MTIPDPGIRVCPAITYCEAEFGVITSDPIVRVGSDAPGPEPVRVVKEVPI